jgi:hypothetical protein
LLLSFRFALNSCSRGPADCRPTVSGNNRKKESVTLITPGEGEQFSRFALANTISRVSRGQTLCRLFNFQDKPLVLCENQKLGDAEHFDYSQKFFLVSDDKNTKPEMTTSTVDEIDDAILKD